MLTTADLAEPVLAQLERVGTPLSEECLCSATGLRPLAARMALWALERDGVVLRTVDGWTCRPSADGILPT